MERKKEERRERQEEKARETTGEAKSQKNSENKWKKRRDRERGRQKENRCTDTRRTSPRMTCWLVPSLPSSKTSESRTSRMAMIVE